MHSGLVQKGGLPLMEEGRVKLGCGVGMLGAKACRSP